MGWSTLPPHPGGPAGAEDTDVANVAVIVVDEAAAGAGEASIAGTPNEGSVVEAGEAVFQPDPVAGGREML